MPTKQTIIAQLGNYDKPEVKLAEEQSVSDIIRAVLSHHVECEPYYDRIYTNFIGADDWETCLNLFEFVQGKVEYKIEGVDRQVVSSPQTILRRGSADCKCYSLFIGGCLDAMRRAGRFDHDWCYRFASYNLFSPTPGHVFVVVDPGKEDEIWIDAVLPEMDDRFPRPIWKRDRYPYGYVVGYARQKRASRVGALRLRSVRAIGQVSAPPTANWPFPDHSPAGVSTPYGLSTWIPTGYPDGLPRPYVIDGKIILRPWLPPSQLAINLFDGSQQANINMAYLMAALQGAVNVYAQTPFNVNYTLPGGYAAWKDLKFWTVAADPNLRNSFILGQIHMGNDDGDINWMNPPAEPSGLDYIHDDVVNTVPAAITAGLNALVPGLGTELANLTSAPSTNPGQVQQVEGQIIQQQVQQQQSSSRSKKILLVAVLVAAGVIFLTD